MKRRLVLDNLQKLDIPKSFIILTYLLSSFPILTYGMRSVITIFWALLGVICFAQKTSTKEYVLNKKEHYPSIAVILMILPYITLLISLIYSEDVDEGIKKLIQMLSLFIFPIIFFFNKNLFPPKDILRIGYLFLLSVIILVFYQIFLVVQNIDLLLSDLSYAELRSNNLLKSDNISIEKINQIKLRRFRNFCIDSVDTHTTYQGTWIGFSLFLLGKEFLSKKLSVFLKIIIIIVGIVLLGWMLLLSTRMPLIALFTGIFMSLFIIKKYSVKFYIALFISLITLGACSYLFITPLKLRMDEIIHTKFDLPTDGEKIELYNSTNVRNGIYFCAMDIFQNNPLYGVGVGDVQHELNDCYKSKIGAKIYTWDDYNSHNQFLFYFLSTGIIGGLVFIILTIFQLLISYKRKDITYFFLITFTALICFTENLLVRSDGVIFYAFFSGLLMFNVSKK